MHYYQARIRALSDGRYLNLHSERWIVCWGTPTSEKKTFNLRKIYENNFILEVDGLWLGYKIANGKVTNLLSASFKSAGKEQAFQITPLPNLSDRVRIMASNGVFAQAPKGHTSALPVNFTPTARLDDDGVFVMEPVESKLEIMNQGNNSNQGAVASVPAVLDNIRPLDGTKVQFQSVYLKKYLCSENGGGTLVAANRDKPEDKNWETFELWAIPGTRKYLFQVSGGKFMGLDGKLLAALSNTPGKVETFEIIQKDNDFTRVRIKAWDDKFLQAKEKDSVTAETVESTPDAIKWNEWGNDDQTIFLLTIVRATIPNGRTIKAIEGAAQKLKEHPPPEEPKTTNDPLPPSPEEEETHITEDPPPSIPNTKDPPRPPTPPTPPVPQKPDIIPPSPSPKDLSNRGFLDGIRLQFKSVMQQKNICVQGGDKTTISANQTSASCRETFKLRRITEMVFQIQAFNGQFIGQDMQGKSINMVANSNKPGKWEMVEIRRISEDPTCVRIKAPNGSYLQAKSDGSVTADFPSNRVTVVNDASVFMISIVTEEEWSKIVGSCNDEGNEPQSISSIKAVNLGGWLVTDGSIKPHLFENIPNKDLLDGTEVQLKSVSLEKYLSAKQGGGANITANALEASDWETFKLWRTSENTFQFRACTRRFVGLDIQGDDGNVVAIDIQGDDGNVVALDIQRDDGNVVAMSNTPGTLETFKIIWYSKEEMLVRIMAHDGRFLQANLDGKVQAVQSSSPSPLSLFSITIVSSLRGEFQLVNGYGTYKAAEVLREHWKEFIGKEDFMSISERGLDAVRIPVGWWIASYPNPPWPFVGGSLNALDNAFSWAETYGLDVIISLYAAPGSQNGLEQSGTRDSFQSWGKTNKSINQTVEVIDFLSARYADNPRFIAIELLDKPMASEITLERLVTYYKKGYEAVRKHSSSVYVIMSNRLYADSKELLEFASSLKRSVINVYFHDFFAGADNDSLAAELNSLTTTNGPLIFIGEWTEKVPAKTDMRMSTTERRIFRKAKLEALKLATFGWAYWTLKPERFGVWGRWQSWAAVLNGATRP